MSRPLLTRVSIFCKITKVVNCFRIRVVAPLVNVATPIVAVNSRASLTSRRRACLIPPLQALIIAHCMCDIHQGRHAVERFQILLFIYVRVVCKCVENHLRIVTSTTLSPKIYLYWKTRTIFEFDKNRNEVSENDKFLEILGCFRVTRLAIRWQMAKIVIISNGGGVDLIYYEKGVN